MSMQIYYQISSIQTPLREIYIITTILSLPLTVPTSNSRFKKQKKSPFLALTYHTLNTQNALHFFSSPCFFKTNSLIASYYRMVLM